MGKINMAELLADRLRGTDGPWEARPHNGYIPEEWDIDPMEVVSAGGDVICSNEAYYNTAPSPIDQRRIARLPDLESAYIEAVEIVKALMDTLPPVATDEKLAAVGRAKVFLAETA